MYKNKNKNTRDKATQPAPATNAVSSPPCTNYEELDELQLERSIAGNYFDQGQAFFVNEQTMRETERRTGANTGRIYTPQEEMQFRNEQTLRWRAFFQQNGGWGFGGW